MNGMNTSQGIVSAVNNAINASIRENRIARITQAQIFDCGSTQALIDYMLPRCEDWVANGDVIEFWGTDDDGDEWRVHVERARGE